MIYVARSSTSRWLLSPYSSASLSLFPRHDLLLKLSKLVSVARVIYLRLNEIECRLNSPRPDNSHNFIRRQAGQRETEGQRDWRADRACFDICIDLYIHIDRANRFLLAVEWERGIFLSSEFWISEIIIPVDKSPKFRWPLPSATAQLALGLLINLNLIFSTAF